jgi:hypothetical protein
MMWTQTRTPGNVAQLFTSFDQALDINEMSDINKSLFLLINYRLTVI